MTTRPEDVLKRWGVTVFVRGSARFKLAEEYAALAERLALDPTNDTARQRLTDIDREIAARRQL